MQEYITHVNYMGLDLVVGWEHEPAEAPTLECPGCESEVALTDVFLHGDDILPILSAKAEDDLLELAMLPE